MADSNPIGLVESAVSIAVLVVVVYVVAEVLATVPGTGIDSNPLSFLTDWMDQLGETNDTNDSDNGGIW